VSCDAGRLFIGQYFFPTINIFYFFSSWMLLMLGLAARGMAGELN